MTELEELKRKYDVVEDFEFPKINVPNLISKLKGINVIIGSSGSGKSTILNTIDSKQLKFKKDIPIIENFSSLEIGVELLTDCGLVKKITWFNPHYTLSNGEQHRFEVALSIDQNVNVIDEFTSMVNRTVAKELCLAINKHKDKIDKLFLAACHKDIIKWLQPKSIYDTDSKEFLSDNFLSDDKKDMPSISQYNKIGHLNKEITL